MRDGPRVGEAALDGGALLEVAPHVVVRVPRDLKVERVDGDDDGANVCVNNVPHKALLKAVEERRVVKKGEAQKVINVLLDHLGAR